MPSYTGTMTSSQGTRTLDITTRDVITFTPTSGTYTVEYPLGTVAINASSSAQSITSNGTATQLRVVCLTGSLAFSNVDNADSAALSQAESAAVQALVSGAVISGAWRGIPAAGPVMRVRMTGIGTVSMDSATGDLGAGTVSTAVYTATVAGTQIDDYAYPGDAARSIRFTLTGTAAVEVY